MLYIDIGSSVKEKYWDNATVDELIQIKNKVKYDKK